jgi:preprotein translocase subunit SecA
VDIRKKAVELREKVKSEGTDSYVVEAFALAREAARRSLGMRPFDVQVIGGLVLHEGKIAEMKTGEGKTLAATMPIFLNALTGKGVHLVTVNDYLARRDALWMGPIYLSLGLSVGVINQLGKSYEVVWKDPERVKWAFEKNLSVWPNDFDDEVLPEDSMNEEALEAFQVELREISRREAYDKDVTYGTNNEFGFDYLRDNLVYDVNDKVQRGHYYAIVDEVDSILIDEARTPLIISGPSKENPSVYKFFAQLARAFKKDEDFVIDEKARTVILTEKGIEKAEKRLNIDNLYDPTNVKLLYHILNALKALYLFKRDVDYIVTNNEVVIVDEFTGRLLPGRRYSGGLHQAIEAKEGVPIKAESITYATITFQNYFRMYEKLAGMTGTAKTEEEEFIQVYNMEVVVVPTHKPMIRVDHDDLIYRSEEEKFKAVVDEIAERHKKGQPVLVGTTSIEKSEKLSQMLRKKKIPHEVLNAKHHEKEAQIIAKAGQKGAVTIATNMAGRGTDIKLGPGVAELGGLYVIGTEHHEARRIDNQLRGRSGRQGDPGESRFFVSLEDDLLRIFGGEQIGKIMNMLKIEPGKPIYHPMLTKLIEKIQKKVESINFSIRKSLMEMDEVLDKQRDAIYSFRNYLLTEEDYDDQIREIFEDVIERRVSTFIQKTDWDLKGLAESFSNFPAEIGLKNVENQNFKSEIEISEFLFDKLWNAYLRKKEELGEDYTRVMRFLI